MASKDKKIPDKIFDSTVRDQAYFDRYAVDLNKRVQGLLASAQNDIVAALAKNDPSAPTMTKWRQQRLETLNKDISAIVGDTYKKIGAVTNNGLIKSGNLQTQTAAAGVNKAIGVDIFKVTVTPSDVKAIVGNTLIDGRTIGEWWDKQSTDVKAKLSSTIAAGTQALQVGMVQGESIGQLIGRVRGSATTPGVMSVTKREAEALVRTSVMQVSSVVRQELYKGNADVLDGFEIIETLDAATCPQCQALDGKRYDMSGNPIGHSIPYPGHPVHFNCRGTIMPIPKSFKDLTGPDSPLTEKQIAKLDNIPVGERASMNGPVSGNITYQDWLLQQPTMVQEDILGKTRYKLWSENKLDVGDLVTDTGHSLTIKELETRFGEMYMLPSPEPVVGLVSETVAVQYPDWVPVKTVDEAAKVFKEQFKIDRITATGKQVGELNASGKALSDIKKLPRFVNKELPYLQEFELIDKTKTTTQLADKVEAFYRPDAKYISIGSKGKRLEDTLGFSRFSVGEDIGSLTRHEYGHFLWDDALTKGEKAEWVDLFFKKEALTSGWIEKNISKYASTNSKEAFAEAFTAYTSPLYGIGKNRTLPKEIEEYFAKTFGKAQVGKIEVVIEKGVKQDLAMVSKKVELAKASHLPATREVQIIARENQALAALKSGGIETPDNHPFDIIRGKDYIELKTIVRAANDKITMHPESLLRKNEFVKDIKGAKAHTLIIDERTGKVYYSPGLGSFRLTSMEEIGAKNNFGPNLLKRLKGQPIEKVATKVEKAVVEKVISKVVKATQEIPVETIVEPVVGKAVSKVVINNAVDSLQSLVSTGGSGANVSALGAEEQAFLRKTVENKSYEVFRGIHVMKFRVTPEQYAELRKLNPGDAAPEFLRKQGNDFTSTSLKESVAKSYAKEGNIEVVLKATLSREDVLCDTTQIEKLLKSVGKGNLLDSETYAYFKRDREIFVKEPIRFTIHSIKVRK